MKFLCIFSLMLSITAIVLCSFTIQDRDDNDAFTPDDLLWAIDAKLMKINLSTSDNIRMVQLVLLDKNGIEVDGFTRFGYMEDDNNILTGEIMLTIKDENKNIFGKFGMIGSSAQYRIDDFISSSGWVWTSEARRNGSYIHVAGNGSVISSGKNPFSGSTKILSVKLFKKNTEANAQMER